MQIPWRGRDGPGKDSILPTANIPLITGLADDAADGDRPSRPSRHARTTSAHARVKLLFLDHVFLFANTFALERGR